MTTIFRWGYWDWGNCADKFVKLADAVEKQAGFGKPVFVDIRYSRSVRAPAFRQGAFAEIAGAGRYHWIRGLGNRGIETGTMEIAEPAAANELLDLAVAAVAKNRRLIFFCSCPSPGNAHTCHRRVVARLVAAAARRRGVAVEVVEWPGGRPAARLETIAADPIEIDFLDGLAKDSHFRRPLGQRLTANVVERAGQAIARPAKVSDGTRTRFVAEMRVVFDKKRGEWMQESALLSAKTQASARTEAEHLRRSLGLDTPSRR